VNAGKTWVATAYCDACLAELDAPKPGNIHRYASGDWKSVEDFAASAEASATAIGQSDARVGKRIRQAVAATQAAVGVNTNLGIILLCAPLAAAAQSPGDLRAGLAIVLNALDRADASDAFAAIAAANPGGLGRAARHDVQAPARVTLLEAMAEAAGRDTIARQYATGFADVFSLGLLALKAARQRYSEPKWATLAVYLAFLCALPDSHIARKFGAPIALEVQANARQWRARFDAFGDPAGRLEEILTWDAELKARALNPGTSADLTVATLFADSLLERRSTRLALTPQQ
jgi:triphosphoribosyl-dephospho-CoA synthase